MIYSETINQIAFGDEVDEVRLLVDGKWLKVKKETVCQYTGLNDKNGTEIYEGDIVKFGEDEVFYEVYQHDSGSWDARGLSLWEWISENGNENEWEVLGSFYENPELLEGRK